MRLSLLDVVLEELGDVLCGSLGSSVLALRRYKHHTFQTLHTSFGFCSRRLQDQAESAAVSADGKKKKRTSDTEALGKTARPFEVTANSISLGGKAAAASSSDHLLKKRPSDDKYQHQRRRKR